MLDIRRPALLDECDHPDELVLRKVGFHDAFGELEDWQSPLENLPYRSR